MSFLNCSFSNKSTIVVPKDLEAKAAFLYANTHSSEATTIKSAMVTRKAVVANNEISGTM
jgi:hypothetical protein